MMLEYTIRLGKELEIVGRRFFDPPVAKANSDMAKSIASLTSDHGRLILAFPRGADVKSAIEKLADGVDK